MAWVPTKYPFSLNRPDLVPCYWKTEMEELKKMSLTPGNPVVPVPVTKEVDALKKTFLEEQQQQIKPSSTYQSRNRADLGRALLPTAPMFKRPTSALTNSFSPTVSWALPGVVKESHPVPIPSVGKVKMLDILGQILLVLIGLLAGFFL